MRELNRLGLTSAIDAGGGFQNYPDDYQVIRELADQGQLTVRIAYNLFTQKPKEELADFKNWTGSVSTARAAISSATTAPARCCVLRRRLRDFLEPRPDLPQTMEQELEPVVRHLVEQRWPFRLHATYDESISRMLDVFEKVDRDIPFNGLPWFFDHAETITPRNIERVRALGGGIAIQDRMAFQGEYFVDRYGAKAAEAAADPAHARRGRAGGAGTDATRVSSYNPWTSLYWLVSGRTVGGMALYPQGLPRNRVAAVHPRQRLVLQRAGQERTDQGWPARRPGGAVGGLLRRRGRGHQGIESVLTVVDAGRHAAAEFDKLGPPAPPVLPDWSPVAKVPGHWRQGAPTAQVHQCVGACAVHAHEHNRARHSNVPVSDFQGFWGAFGCSCFAF